MDLTVTLGMVAGALTTLAYLPQVVKIWRTKSADSLSWTMLLVLCAGVSLWLVYGMYVHDTPLVMANLVTLMLSSIILGLKISYEALPRLQSRPRIFAWGWRR